MPDWFEIYQTFLNWYWPCVMFVLIFVVGFWPQARGKGFLLAYAGLGFLVSIGFRVLNMFDHMEWPEVHFVMGNLLRFVGVVGHMMLAVGLLRLRTPLQAADDAEDATWSSGQSGGASPAERDTMSPLETGSHDIVAHLSSSGAAISSPRIGEHVCQQLRDQLSKQLEKQGYSLQWKEQAAGASLVVELVQVEEGNQFLRWLLPFISPAVVEVEGELLLEAGRKTFHLSRRTDIAMFGGSGQRMTKVCATRLAKGIRKWLLTTI